MNTRDIEAAKPGQVLWDDKVPGLHVRVFDKKRAFYLKIRTRTGKQARPKLGDYGILTLPAARDDARERINSVYKGGDAVVPRTSQPLTIEDLKTRFMEKHSVKRKPKTQEMYKHSWNHILPVLGKVPVTELKRSQVVELFESISAPVAANRALAVLHKAMNLAEVWEWREENTNPVHLIERNKEKKRKRVPDEREGPAIFRALFDFDHEVFVGLVLLLCFTGCRRNEIQTAKREWVKADGLHLPDSKSDEKVVPLPRAAREVIAKLPVMKDNPYLIPGRRKGQHLKSVQRLWDRVLEQAKVSGITMHDLRRYYVSRGLSVGLPLETLGQLLGHTQAQTTKGYAYLDTRSKQQAAETAAAEMVRISRAARRSRH